MTRTDTRRTSSTPRLLGSLLFAVACNLAIAYVLGSAPTQAQRYASAHADKQPALARPLAAGHHRSWYA